MEAFLENHPYVKGFAPTSADHELFEQLSACGAPETPNLRPSGLLKGRGSYARRWFDHIESFPDEERAQWVKA